MTQRLAPHLAAFGLNDALLAGALRAIPEHAADVRLDERTQPARNVAVHMLASRHALCARLGGHPEPLPWTGVGEAFEAGFLPDGPRPRLAAILDAWNRLAPRFRESLLAASAEVLAQPSPLPVPGLPQPTLADFVGVNVVHESYHLGQIGLLAKAITGKGIMTPSPQGAGV